MEHGEPGESRIKPQYLGFHYSAISLGSSSDDSSSQHRIKKMKKTPQKSPKKAASPIIISSGDDGSPESTYSLPTPRMDYIDLSTPIKSEIDNTEYGLMFKNDRRRVTKKLFKNLDNQQTPDFELVSDEPSSDSSNLPDIFNSNVENTISALTESQRNMESLQEEDNGDEFRELYDNDPCLPVFKRMEKGIRTADAVELLLRNLNKNQLARNIPIEITKNVSFVYSVNNIGHWKNAMCDGMGKWEQMGKETSYVDVRSTGISIISPNDVNDNTLKVVRRKYKNGSCSSLHRILIILENTKTGDILDQMFVQYYFIGEEKKVNIKPHGNSKGNSSYKRTTETTKKRIVELCNLKKNPKDVFHSALEEQGGIEKARSVSCFPRDRMQISNFKRSVKESGKQDPLYRVH